MVNDKRLGTVTRDLGTPRATAAIVEEMFGGLPVYLPAFRSVLESINRDGLDQRPQVQEETRQQSAEAMIRAEMSRIRKQVMEGRGIPAHMTSRQVRKMAYKTLLCRDWFDEFVPMMRCPSLWEIAEQIRDELSIARLSVAESDRAALSGVFSNVLTAVMSTEERLAAVPTSARLLRIRGLLATLQESGAPVPSEYRPFLSTLKGLEGLGTAHSFEAATVSRILQVYEAALEAQVTAQEEAFRQLRTFEGSVNRLLAPKRLDLISDSMRDPRLGLPRIHLDEKTKKGFGILSSGERHILTLLFSSTHMTASDGIVLIDEPELSLHVDWQRSILTELTKQAGDRQIIVCTHSPEVAADHQEALVGLHPEDWTPPTTHPDDEELTLDLESE